MKRLSNDVDPLEDLKITSDRKLNKGFGGKLKKKLKLPAYDFKTFYRHGKVWTGRNPYID